MKLTQHFTGEDPWATAGEIGGCMQESDWGSVDIQGFDVFTVYRDVDLIESRVVLIGNHKVKESCLASHEISQAEIW